MSEGFKIQIRIRREIRKKKFRGGTKEKREREGKRAGKTWKDVERRRKCHGVVNHPGGLTVVPGYHPLHKSRKARCPVISVNPRGGSRPENIRIDLPADLSLPISLP